MRHLRRPSSPLTVTLAVAACATLLGASTAPPPRALDRLESGAEDAYDQALAGRTQEVRRTAAQLEKDWKAARPEITRAGGDTKLVAAVDGAVGRLGEALREGASGAALARAANAVSAPMPELFGLYRTATPPGLLRLDYLGREIALDASTRRLDDARVHLGRLEAAWKAVRPKVEARSGGRDAALAYERSLYALKTALRGSEAAAVRSAADATLEAVDGLEKVF